MFLCTSTCLSQSNCFLYSIFIILPFVCDNFICVLSNFETVVKNAKHFTKYASFIHHSVNLVRLWICWVYPLTASVVAVKTNSIVAVCAALEQVKAVASLLSLGICGAFMWSPFPLLFLFEHLHIEPNPVFHYVFPGFSICGSHFSRV